MTTYPSVEYKQKMLDEYNAKSGIDHLRLLVKNLDYCNESFNEQFSAAELLKIHRAWMLSGWDIYPDTWTARQIKEALAGKSPNWDERERPKYEDQST